MSSLSTENLNNKTIGYFSSNEFKSLHDAVRSGSVEGISRMLMENKAQINDKDQFGNTPLLMAVCIEDESVYNKIVRILIDSGADVNAFNKGFTPLYNAVFYQRLESVKMLLEAGAWLRPCSKNELHLLAENGGCSTLNLLLSDNRCTQDVVNAVDENGYSPLYLAALHGHESCLKKLIEHGANINHKDREGVNTIELMFCQTCQPVKIITEVLDDRIRVKSAEKGKCSYVVDFSVLVPKNCERQMDVISNLLGAASDTEKTEVLQHPLIELFLILKWSRTCHFFYLWISIYFIFVMSMSAYVTMILHLELRSEFAINIIRIALIMSSCGLLCHAILQCVLSRKNYIRRYEMWMNVIGITLSLTVATAGHKVWNETGIHNTPNWVLHVSSIAILLDWLQLMLLIGRLPTFGYYALMFSAVLQNVIKVLLAFLCLVIGFCLSFSIQFRNTDQFSNPWRAIVKTIVMMTGEFEYGDLFADSADASNRLPSTSRIIFLLFIILTSIVLMNLMVGLAVNDIQGLQKESHARRLEKQAEFLCQLEKVISSKHLYKSRFVPGFLKMFLLRKCTMDVIYEFNTSCQFMRKRGLPSSVVDAIIQIAKAKKMLEKEN